jgi:hypothetical protein
MGFSWVSSANMRIYRARIGIFMGFRSTDCDFMRIYPLNVGDFTEKQGGSW